MARYNGLSPIRWLCSVAACCYCVFLLRHTGGGVTAQTDGGAGNNTSSSTSEYPACLGYTQHIGDGYCDEGLNNADCGFDGGDCCVCTCGASGAELVHPCGEQGDGFDCRDPDVPADCGVTPSPAASFGYPDCTGYLGFWQDSYCDIDLNNAACGYDGGDCCRCTCREYASETYFSDFFSDDSYYPSDSDTCGAFGYDCKDPEAPGDCATASPTPTPDVGDGYTFDDDTLYYGGCPWNSDGMCDREFNTAECDWDGGDCCQCDCLEIASPDYPCGITGYSCLDPSSTCTSSSSGSSWNFYHDDANNMYNSPGYRWSSSTDNGLGDGNSPRTESSEAGLSSVQLASVFGVSVGVFCVLGGVLLAVFVALRRRRSSGGSQPAGGANQPSDEVTNESLEETQ